jgi:hypothetical protein
MLEQHPPAQSDSPIIKIQRSPDATYHERCDQFAQQREHYRWLGSLNANLNVVLVLAALACLGLELWRGGVLLFVAAVLFAVSFVAAYINLGRLNQFELRFHTLWKINDEGLRRLQRDWANLPLPQPPVTDPDHPYAADLDLLGHTSLQHLLGTPNTPVGQITVQDWLLHPALPSIALQRQAAAAELAPQIDFRDSLALSGRLMGATQPTYERFLEWAEDQLWLAQRPWLVWLTRLLPVLVLGLLGIQLVGLIAYPLWLPVLAVNIALSMTLGRQANGIIDAVEERQRVFRSYADLFQLITTHTSAAPRLQQLQADLSAGGLRADQQMLRLARMMPLADIRQMMFFFLIQWLTLWNFHVVWLLERWQRTAGQHARAWLAALGEVEALAALAALRYDHPDWTFPAIRENQQAAFMASNLGHPLLPPGVCVGNDVTIGPPGTFLLVTGSNMSGKSTLLRAIGTNIVLAQMGGPVCASQMTIRPITLATVIRVQDSLEQGISYFMAELKRLKQVVDRAQQAQLQGESTLLFLLDEILHGTNTRERQIAVRQVVLHLLSQSATGAISTHDLSLAGTPEITRVSQPVHFTETFTRGAEGLTMQFDYKLHPGITASTNALKLLEIVGLPVDSSTI